MNGWKTLTGMDLATAFKSLDDYIPGAYKQITGGKAGQLGLTDIKPGYLPRVLLSLFGPCGIGWCFSVLAMETTSASVTRNSGKQEIEFTATCNISVWYRFMDGEGKERVSDSTVFPGGSSNTQREWAEKGAVTNALGNAWFLMGYQISVYTGERDHNTRQPTKADAMRQQYTRIESALKACKSSEERASVLIAEKGMLEAMPEAGRTKLEELAAWGDEGK